MTSSQRKIRRPTEKQLDTLVRAYSARRSEFQLFLRQVFDYFQLTPKFQDGSLPLVHSLKSRLKDPEHLREKIIRKWKDGPIRPDSLFSKITDCAGVRVLHLHSNQFPTIHSAIISHVEQGFWYLAEPPVAYSWDPEAKEFFENIGLTAKQKETFYTSIHYLVKPQENSDLTCEIQVRTLFEEIWGELDHHFNYPEPTRDVSCKEQLRVLAKLASTGTRLADSIFKSAGSSNTTARDS